MQPMTHTKEALLAEIKKHSKRIIDYRPRHESVAETQHKMAGHAKLISWACSDLAVLMAKEEKELKEIRAVHKK